MHNRLSDTTTWRKDDVLVGIMGTAGSGIRELHDVISGLEYLHDFGIVHADLKAKNVLVSESKRAVLADFGASRISEALPTTSVNGATGTPYWMAPELLIEEGSSPSRESDVWSFGCLCYEVELSQLFGHSM
ncbi:Mitogen-activated protein kinase kinase kinase 3 [Leucoagaricus sp. SymC.cos]|nr:Mitogen-activated protein kinase kinase kinase 3 [Leucoagaricus sp. SymC.cos]